VPVQPIAGLFGKMVDNARHLDKPIERKRSNLRRRDQRITKERTCRFAQRPALVRVRVPQESFSANDFYIRSRLVQESG
jgi:hypothetical protein